MWNYSRKRKVIVLKDIDCHLYILNLSQSNMWTTILLVKNVGSSTQCDETDSPGWKPGKVCFTHAPTESSFCILHLSNQWYKFNFLFGMLPPLHQLDKYLTRICDRNSAQTLWHEAARLSG